MAGIGKLLKQKVFRRYFYANSLAYIGTNMGLLGINWHLIAVTGSNQILSIYSAVTVMTTIISSLFIGTLVDIFNKSILMKVSNVVQAGMITIIYLMITFKNAPFQLIYFMAVANSIGLALFGTSSRSILQDVLSNPNDFIHGNSLIEICIQLGAIVASCMTGFLYAIFGFSVIIYIMVGSLMLSAFSMKYIKETKINKRNAKEKIHFNIISQKGILTIGLITFVPYIVTLLSNSVLPGYVSKHLHATSQIYGNADMLYGAGAVIAGFIVSKSINKSKHSMEGYLFIISVLSLITLFFNKMVLLLFLLYFFFGLSNTSLKICLNTLFMKSIPKEIYGKCYALMNSMVSLLQIFLLFMLGKMLDSYGAQVGYLILAVLMGVSGIVYMKVAVNK